MQDKKQTDGDIYDKYHKFPGDTSEGRWLTVLFSLIGVLISVAEFFLYLEYKHIAPLMISFCFFNAIYNTLSFPNYLFENIGLDTIENWL